MTSQNLLISRNPETPLIGDVVRVRSRVHVVEFSEWAPYGTTVDLACLDDSAQGELLSVLWEAELDTRILTRQAWESIGQKYGARDFDSREYFASFYNTLRWQCVTATDPNLFQSPFRAGIKLDAYQLDPLHKALRLPRVNLFIADDVGLGKTIEAGLIASELLLRKRIQNVIVSCPPSMLHQWKAELDSRFGLEFKVLDREYIEGVRQQQGFAVNPWTTYPHFLVSHRLLIDDTYSEPLKHWLDQQKPHALFILDEAHHAAPASGSKYAIDSRFTRVIRELAQRFDHRIFLSATPHNGHSNSFSALLEILDPQRFVRGVPVVKANLTDVMIRRLKSDIRALEGGFPERVICQTDIDGLPTDAPELRLSEMLARYQAIREEQVKNEAKHIRNRSLIVFSHLQQRLLSSPEAFARTISKHAETAERKFSPTADTAFLTRGIDPDCEEAQLDEEQQEDLLAAELRNADPITQLNQEATQLLHDMVDLASEARYRPDAKVLKLLDWIAGNQCHGIARGNQSAQPGATWTDTRVIIFTEWDASLTYLRHMLHAALAGTDRSDERILIFRGSTSSDSREEIKKAFNSAPGAHPVRILLATDAAREGINLQSHCQHLFHYDIPWNPGRLEQRNGRIDRKLQPEPQVFCHYFVYQQRQEDRVLDALVKKTSRIQQELGSLSQVLDRRLSRKLEFGISMAQVSDLITSIDQEDAQEEKAVAEAELEEARERQDALQAQVKTLENRIDQARRAINYSHEAFEQALSTSLRLNHYSPLSPSGTTADGETCYSFPKIATEQALDPSWTTTLDTLRAAPEKGRRDHQWRKDSPIRPIRFTAPPTIDDTTVQIHLGHRVAKRLLSRFLCQGFVNHDISRACLAQSDDAVPRVILLGRLGLFGKHATRLHEEIITITAPWKPPAQRGSAPLKAYARETEARTLEILERSMLSSGTSVPADERQALLDSIPADVAELLPLLEDRAKDSEADARKKLHARSEAEAKAMIQLLEGQKKRVEAKLKDALPPDQLELFNFEEQAQVERETKAQRKWLEDFTTQIESEPARIREFYEIKTTRIEPVGLVYLWPQK
ncbi:DISARM system SNF2-like helicase DrmD [Luteolibacter arcticus]|uniref:DISARM system SNF2-like helicase DrmD n=1 Tax=Luteolibacter arcticus TaxID=1581411 RepID=A0ABT3GLB8_9BACT|nr:DISARM system SNF2-like helicase DrmD [Luteolibacter arcticus]MCW1924261.1 DISARM system SNF2-like helicase DrmD [Luteolibacter arcticus]